LAQEIIFVPCVLPISCSMTAFMAAMANSPELFIDLGFEDKKKDPLYNAMVQTPQGKKAHVEDIQLGRSQERWYIVRYDDDRTRHFAAKELEPVSCAPKRKACDVETETIRKVQNWEPQGFAQLQALALQRLEHLQIVVAQLGGRSAEDRKRLVELVQALGGALLLAPDSFPPEAHVSSSYADGVHVAYMAEEARLREDASKALTEVDLATRLSTQKAQALTEEVAKNAEKDELQAYLQRWHSGVGTDGADGASSGHLTREEQLRRNRDREELLEKAQKAMQTISEVRLLQELPASRLAEVQQSVFCSVEGSLDVHCRLAQALEIFKQDLRQDLSSCGSRIAQSMNPAFEAIKAGFRERLKDIVENESQARGDLYQDKLASLRQQEDRYVRANDSPSKNKDFKNILDEIDDTSVLLNDLQGAGHLQVALLAEVRELQERLAEEETVEASPRPLKRRRFEVPRSFRSLIPTFRWSSDCPKIQS